MVPAFGFSVGDFVAGTKVIINVFRAFKETGGASTKYTREVAFLEGLNKTLEHLKELVENPSDDYDLAKDVSKQIKGIQGPLNEFHAFLDTYEGALGEPSTSKGLKKSSKMFKYTLKDMSGKVERLRVQIDQPLQAISLLLSLRAMYVRAVWIIKSCGVDTDQQVSKTLETPPHRPFSPEQCAQIVEAIRTVGIPVELDKQIRILQKLAAEHGIKNDEQIQRIEGLRSELDSQFAYLNAEVKASEEATIAALVNSRGTAQSSSEDCTAQQGIDRLTVALESRDNGFELTLKKQEDLILALKTFLEEKVAALEAKSDPQPPTSNTKGNCAPGHSWPSTTLKTAHLAVGLLSAIVTSVATLPLAHQVHAHGRRREVFYPPKKPLVTYTYKSLDNDSDERKGEWHARDHPPVLDATSHERPLASFWIKDFSNAHQEPQTAHRSAQSRHNVSDSLDDDQNILDMAWSRKPSKLDIKPPTSGGVNGSIGHNVDRNRGPFFNEPSDEEPMSQEGGVEDHDDAVPHSNRRKDRSVRTLKTKYVTYYRYDLPCPMCGEYDACVRIVETGRLFECAACGYDGGDLW